MQFKRIINYKLFIILPAIIQGGGENKFQGEGKIPGKGGGGSKMLS